MRDSSVICAYLERRHPDPALYPKGAADYAQAQWFEEYADGTLFREVVHGLFFQKIIRPNILKEQGDAAAVATILNQALPKVFGYLEGSLRGEFLANGRFGVADIAITSNLINFRYLGYDIDRRTYPRLAASMRLDNAFVQR